jgi:hypothetical protein
VPLQWVLLSWFGRELGSRIWARSGVLILAVDVVQLVGCGVEHVLCNNDGGCNCLVCHCSFLAMFINMVAIWHCSVAHFA